MLTADQKIIAQHYAALADTSLQNLLETEGYKLSNDLFLLLKTEYEKRKLNPERLHQIQLDRDEAGSLGIDPSLLAEKDGSAEAFWQVLFIMKLRNYPEEKMKAFLNRKGFNEEEANSLLEELYTQSSLQVRRHRQRVTAGILLLLTGLVTISLTLATTDPNALYHLGWVLLFISISMIFRGRKEYEIAEKVMYLTEKEGLDKIIMQDVQKTDSDPPLPHL